MLSFLGLGFLIGLQHALEPDHVAAVVSISTRGGRLRDHARNGALWGIGHALMLLAVAGTCVALGVVIPERASELLEGAVGVMLVVLGASVVVRLRRRGIHVHAHEHADGTRHLHAHGHPRGEPTHEHAHPARLSTPRTLLVGAIHGVAGSAALVLLVGATAQSPQLGLAYIALFGLGAVVGMMALAATISLPLGWSARRVAGAHRVLCVLVGLFSVGLGLSMVWSAIRLVAA